MAKTHNNLYQRLLSYESLETAFYKVAKGKSNKKVVSDFRNNLPIELLTLLNELKSDTYEPRQYKEFIVYEPKKRLIQAPHFRDVVVQRAIHDLINPIFESTFITDSYGCRVNKGTHRASDKAQQLMRSCQSDSYYLQMDISKYFYSIDREILINLLSKKISDKRLLVLLSKFIPNETGIPIGNILSQLFSNIYLNEIDQFCKRKLLTKNYVRYVDDFIIIGYSKQEIHGFLTEIENITDVLKLRLSRFTIQKINKGINFCGYRTWKRTKFLRKKSLNKFKVVLNNHNNRGIMSCLGHAKPSANYSGLIKITERTLCQLYISTNQLSRQGLIGRSNILRTLKRMKLKLSAKSKMNFISQSQMV